MAQVCKLSSARSTQKGSEICKTPKAKPLAVELRAYAMLEKMKAERGKHASMLPMLGVCKVLVKFLIATWW